MPRPSSSDWLIAAGLAVAVLTVRYGADIGPGLQSAWRQLQDRTALAIAPRQPDNDATPLRMPDGACTSVRDCAPRPLARCDVFYPVCPPSAPPRCNY